VGNHFKRAMPTKIEFEKIGFEGKNHEHYLFMEKKQVTTCGTIFLNVADFVLHYVTCAKNTKDDWNNICAKFER